jgi:hypothetical protein
MLVHSHHVSTSFPKGKNTMNKLLFSLAIAVSVAAFAGAAQAADASSKNAPAAAVSAPAPAATTAASESAAKNAGTPAATTAASESTTTTSPSGAISTSATGASNEGQKAVYGEKNAKNLSSAEISKIQTQRFEKLDANKDGKLSLQEFQTVPSDIKTSEVEGYKAYRAELFSQLDSSKQGSISKEQFVQGMTQRAENQKASGSVKKAIPANQPSTGSAVGGSATTTPNATEGGAASPTGSKSEGM